MRDLLIRLYQLLHDPQSPVYEDKIYVPVGVVLIVSTLAIAIFYYFVLNGFRARFSKRWPHWSGCLILNLIIGFIVPIIIIRDLGEDQAAAFGADAVLLCLINSLYSAMFFFIISMVLKWGSPHARRTPF